MLSSFKLETLISIPFHCKVTKHLTKVPILTVVLDQLYTSDTSANNGPGVKLERIMFFLAVRNTPTNFIF